MFHKFVFAAAVTMAIVIGIAYFLPELQTMQGGVHPDFTSMQKAGEPASRSVAWLGWLFGAAVVVLIFSMFSLGVARGRSFRGAGWPMLAVFVATLAAWAGVIIAYGGYTDDPQQGLLFGWPLPTGLMVFVMLPIMFLINIVFVVYFPKSILTEEDLQNFDRVLREQSGDERD